MSLHKVNFHFKHLILHTLQLIAFGAKYIVNFEKMHENLLFALTEIQLVCHLVQGNMSNCGLCTHKNWDSYK